VKRFSVTESSSELHTLLLSNTRFRRNERYHSFCVSVDPNTYAAYDKRTSQRVRVIRKAQLNYKYGVCIGCVCDVCVMMCACDVCVCCVCVMCARAMCVCM